tara:strand:- start:4787 stop:5170 length:384 start_codon:yes stop_codon:yes gene_type:complete
MGYLTVEQNFDPNDDDNLYTEDENAVVRKKNKVKHCYYSDIVGGPIVNAVTGEKYPWKVGSINEKRFFRVIDTTNNENTLRKGDENTSIGRFSHKAFYETPEAFMNHRNYYELDKEIINNWYSRVNN